MLPYRVLAMQNLKGHLLVASPHLADPNFVKTVVLLIHHSEEGAFGVVLNRPADNTIKELWEQVGETPCESDRRVNVGGPVAGPLMAVHTDKQLGEMEIFPGLYFAAQRDHLEELLRSTDRLFRIFVGHSGWVWAVAFLADGETLVSGGADRSVRVWPTRAAPLADAICESATRDLTVEEWGEFLPADVPWEATCP